MTVVKLDKKSRNALAPEMFAFPRTRQCPINDEHHVKLAWKTIDAAKGVTDDERRLARQLTLAAAQELEIDTVDWHRVKHITLECMSLNLSNDDGHPNKMPFTGVLTRVDQPSDSPPGGSGGRLVMVTAEAARNALGSLLGMAVDFTPSFDGHDVKNKIGLITSADVVGNEVQIAGFIYAADFPETAGLIKSLKNDLGFSFEAQRIYVEDMGAEVLKVTALTFTGAAILLKDKAAYKTTSLAASAADKEFDMTAEELKALLTPMLAEAVKPFTDRLSALETSTATVLETTQAAAKLRNDVEPHAAALETQATALEAAGINADALRKQASWLRSEAAAGRKPTALPAGSTTTVINAAADTSVADQIKAAVDAALKPVTDELAATKTKLTDVENKARLQASDPGRKTAARMIGPLLAKAGITLPEGEVKLQIADVDASLAKANLQLPQRIMVKNELTRLGVL